MNYRSTRDASLAVSSAEAILTGLSPEGGLFVPESFPELTLGELTRLAELPYAARAAEVLSLYLTDFPRETLDSCVRAAYTPEKFGGVDGIGLAGVGRGTWLLELWHGPTCAFKDMALQLLPHLLTASARLLDCDRELVILTATSGDTGKAALEGFRDVPGARILVFYPEDGVSPMQKRQMTTQPGGNVHVCAIRGNFDDCQTAVKQIFTDPELAARMTARGKRFSSANSINWGRLAPQIVYYLSAYSQLCASGELEPGEKVNICVPTGNFGNILAAYYAKRMGLPVGKLLCASNRNRVLSDFIATGVYDKNREFYPTASPSMDILISSNLERLLFELSGRDDGLLRGWYASLAETGRFEVPAAVKARLQSEFWGGWCDDDATRATIRDVFERHTYLCDTHTAVALHALGAYREATGDARPTLVASTANPYKFTGNVLSAIAPPRSRDEYAQIEELFDISGMEVPPQLAALKDAPVRFAGSVAREGIRAEVERVLGIGNRG